MIDLQTPIAEINFFCKKISKKIKKLDLHLARDLIFYYPTRYEDWSVIKKIKELIPGEPATLRIRVELIKNYRSHRQNKKITEAIVGDSSGKMKVLWFNQWYLTKVIFPGDELYLSGKLNPNHYGEELISPEYEKVKEIPTHTARLVPIYPLTEGLTQKQLRTAIKYALDAAVSLPDYLPEKIIKESALLPLSCAILNIHFPENDELKEKARQRLGFDELFFNQLKNIWLKKELAEKKAPPISFHQKETVAFLQSLPFKLTAAQRKTAWEILRDIGKNHPMNRLLNGDVGSGKTLVSAIAIYNTVLGGYQSALLAPTEILAHQHYENFLCWFGGTALKVGLLTKNFSRENNQKISKNECLEKIIQGELNILIGTHALIQEAVGFKNLGLVVVDEQHRFGVEQRAEISRRAKENRESNYLPHLLSMTATPIPRTLSLIFFGDLNLSILDEMPTGRKKIKTFVVAPKKREAAYEFIKKQIKEGRQIFVICPLIDASDILGVKSVTEEYKKLTDQVFPDLKIGFLHGKLKIKEKEEVMRQLKNNEINILVSTSVIEVGIDIPNASVMMIEGAERFGLAQLHQFRGRVGRSDHQSYCLLFPTAGNTIRLKAMEEIDNGFKLAEIDLKVRGPGQIYGAEQSGKLEFKIADINNLALIKQAQEAAQNLLKDDPELLKYPHLREYLEKKIKGVHLE